MAKKTYTTILDDIDGSEDAETVTFSYEGRAYEVDLSAKNKAKFAEALEPYINAGRKTGGRASSGSRSSSKHDLSAVREWASSNGFEVSSRGRVPANVMEAYEAANK